MSRSSDDESRAEVAAAGVAAARGASRRLEGLYTKGQEARNVAGDAREALSG